MLRGDRLTSEIFAENGLAMASRIVAVDLFAGAGGMSLGALWAGIDVQLAVEIDPYASATYAKNHPSTRVITEDVRRIRKVPIGVVSGPRILFGGPPCQGFSVSNQRTRSIRNTSNWLCRDFMRIARQWRPDWVVLENVKGITETERGYFLSLITQELNSCGYKTAVWILNAADFGVPQRRSRVFVIGSSYGRLGPAPAPVAASARRVTVRDAIWDLPRLANGASADWLSYRCLAQSAYARRMRGKLKGCGNHCVTRSSDNIVKRFSCVPQGGNWEDIPSNRMRNYRDRTRCHTGIYHRLELDKPSIVIGNYRKNMLIHPTQDRGLSVREAARLQSFPDWYEFVGSIGFQQQQVGNGVPPLLAFAVFKEVCSQIRGKR